MNSKFISLNADDPRCGQSVYALIYIRALIRVLSKKTSISEHYKIPSCTQDFLSQENEHGYSGQKHNRETVPQSPQIKSFKKN